MVTHIDRAHAVYLGAGESGTKYWEHRGHLIVQQAEGDGGRFYIDHDANDLMTVAEEAAWFFNHLDDVVATINGMFCTLDAMALYFGATKGDAK